MIGIISRYMTIGQTMLVSPTIIYSKFNSKPTIWEILNIIRKEENNFSIDINKIKEGFFKKKKRDVVKFETLMKKYYLSKDDDIRKIFVSHSADKNRDIILNWHDASLFILYIIIIIK